MQLKTRFRLLVLLLLSTSGFRLTAQQSAPRLTRRL
jgi:hypothetical protein